MDIRVKLTDSEITYSLGETVKATVSFASLVALRPFDGWRLEQIANPLMCAYSKQFKTINDAESAVQGFILECRGRVELAKTELDIYSNVNNSLLADTLISTPDYCMPIGKYKLYAVVDDEDIYISPVFLPVVFDIRDLHALCEVDKDKAEFVVKMDGVYLVGIEQDCHCPDIICYKLKVC